MGIGPGYSGRVRPGIWPPGTRSSLQPCDSGPWGLGGAARPRQWALPLPDTQDDQAFGHPTAREQWACFLPLKPAAGEIIVLVILSG